MRNGPTSVMIFAAGFGTRMGDLTKDTPKPLIEVAGKPLLDHALDLLADLGPTRIVANTHFLADRLAPELARRGVMESREMPDILDTGGGLRAALPLLEGTAVLTMNADAVWHGPNPLPGLAETWRQGRMEALLLCVPLDRAVGRIGGGDFTLAPGGELSRGGDAVYTGVQILSTATLDRYPPGPFSLNLVWDDMIARGTARGVHYPGQWCDVGHPGGILQAEHLSETDRV